jgi:hypothetical protein
VRPLRASTRTFAWSASSRRSRIWTAGKNECWRLSEAQTSRSRAIFHPPFSRPTSFLWSIDRPSGRSSKSRPLVETYDVRPIEPLTLAKRAKALNPTDRILLVTIVGLYNSDLARDGFKRDWNPPAVEAFERINALRTSDPDIPPHFYGLLASYPGW